MAEHYSDLQFDTREQYHQNAGSTQKYYVAEGPPHGNRYSDKIIPVDQGLERGQPEPAKKRIFGLPARTFWIVALIVAIIVIAAAVGGGVGGSLAGKNKNNSSTSTGPMESSGSQTSSTSSVFSSSSSSPLATTSPTLSPSSTTITLSTSTTIGPSETLLVDCPSSNNTVYSPTQSTSQFRKICGLTFAGNGENSVNTPTVSLDKCIDLCAAYNIENATEIADGSSLICNAVCWRATIDGDDHPGICFGFTTTNDTTDNFVYNYDARCDSAALI